MTDMAFAASRFGLGARGADSPPDDPRRWLLGQFDRFNAAPAPIRATAASAAVIGDLAEYFATRKEAKQAGNAKPAKPADMAASTPPMAPASAPAMAPAAKLPRDPALREVAAAVRDHYVGAVAARTNAALASDTPFVEAMVHFWANHFALSVDKREVIGLAGAFEFEAIRPHVLGRFGDMLLAVERHPAMLLYLDQAQSVGPDSFAGAAAARRGNRKVGLNENLAREILELHTLGVRTGYSQTDVTEFARALTGWTVAGLRPARMLDTDRPGYTFAARLHQPGTRTVLGRRYGQDGESQARSVLSDLASHPATARHVATKLARHFAADNPPPALVARLETAFLTSHGDLPTLYRVLIDAPECWQGAKFRTPWEWGLASLRAANVPELPGKLAAGTFQQLGQPVWKPGSPAGYDDVAASWAAPDALLRRAEAAGRIAQKAPPADARQLAARLYGDRLSPLTRDAVAGAETAAQAMALLLVSPEMLRR